MRLAVGCRALCQVLIEVRNRSEVNDPRKKLMSRNKVTDLEIL